MSQYRGSFQVSIIDNQRTYIRYALTANPARGEMYESPEGMKYLGICSETDSMTAPEDPEMYQWIPMQDSYVVNIKMKYYPSFDNDIELIPSPANSDYILYSKNGFIYMQQGYIKLRPKSNAWIDEIPPYEPNKYLFEAMEIEMSDGTIIYGTVQASSAWDVYNKLEIGGANLIRNSKTLLDTRIRFYYNE